MTKVASYFASGVFCLVLLGSVMARGNPFDEMTDGFLGHMQKDGDLKIDIPLGYLAVDHSLRIAVRCRHRLKSRSFGRVESTFEFGSLQTSVEWWAERSMAIWTRPNGISTLFVLRPAKGPIDSSSASESSSVWLGHSGGANIRIDGDFVNVSMGNWVLKYVRGGLEEIQVGESRYFVESDGPNIATIRNASSVLLDVRRDSHLRVVEITGNRDSFCASYNNLGRMEFVAKVSGDRVAAMTYDENGLLRNIETGLGMQRVDWVRARPVDIWMYGVSEYKVERVNNITYTHRVDKDCFVLREQTGDREITKKFRISGIKVL